ncbi:MAG TPA: translocation/assembly module TamB domain-containing protein [Saprospiraceae bacterium]|nr:translocation/assembly module TamB domain-containing protein [Saprospiraceae bacterium]
MEGVYFEDRQGDTLFAGEKLLADISVFKLLRNTLEVNELELHGITAYVHRSADSTFNFQYIIDSLVNESAGPVKKDSRPLVISLNDILFERITLKYLDEPSATDIRVMLGYLDADVKKFDLDKQEFEVPKIVLKNSTATFTQRKPLAVPESIEEDIAESGEPIPFDLQLGTIDFENIHLTYTNAISDIVSRVDLGNFSVQSDKLEWENKKVSLNEVNLRHSDISIVLGDLKNTEVLKEEARKEVDVEADVWQIQISAINLEDNGFAFNDNSIMPSSEGIDFSHLGIQDLNLQAQNIVSAGNEFSVEMRSASFLEKSGFELKQLRGDLFLGKTQGHAKDLVLETKNSMLHADVQLRYTDLDSLSIEPEKIYQKTFIRESTIAMADILLLAPGLHDENYFKEFSTEVVTLQADLDGKPGDLVIRQLNFSGLGHTKLMTSGTVRGLPDVEKAVFDLNINQFHTQSADMLAIVPGEIFPATIRLPEDIQVHGRFQGNIREFTVDINTNTSFGDAAINGTLGLNEPMRFQGEVEFSEFDIGQFLKQDSILSTISMQTTVNLRGMDTDSISGEFSGEVQHVGFRRYTYRDIRFSGEAHAGMMQALINMDDPNLKFELDASAHLTENSFPALDFFLDLEHADLHPLHFLDRQLLLRGKAYGDFANIDPDSLDGTLALSDFTFADSARKVVLDTAYLASSASSDGDTLEFKSNFAQLNMSGNYQLTNLFPSITQSVAKYFGTTTEPPTGPMPSQNVELTMQISYSPLFTQLDSSIGRFSPIEVKGNYSSDGDVLNLEGKSELIRYGPATIWSPHFDVKASDNTLIYTVAWDEARSDAISFWKTTLEGKAQDQEITAELNILDSLERKKFHMNALIDISGSQLALSLDPAGLLLDYDQWTISDDNKILIAEGELAVQNFTLSNGEQKLSINSEPFGFNNPIAFEFRDFQIETITEMISGDSLLAGGMINGSARLRDYFGSPVFTADMRIADFNYRQDTIGNIEMLIDNETANTLAAEVTIRNAGNHVDLKGRYFISNEQIDLTMGIMRLELASLQTLSGGNFTNARGSLRGNLNITGTLMKPVVEGDLHFDSASVRVSALNAVYTLANEGIRFSNSDIHFDRFTIADEENNQVNLNGVVYTHTFTNFRFELDIDSKNFKVLDTKAQGNDLYYGTLYLDSRIRIRGGLNRPEITADLTILDKTNMTVIIPQTAPGIVEREGVVYFVELDNPRLDSVLTADLDTFNTFSVKGLVVFAKIHVTDESEFTLVIDQGNGDYLRLRGNAELSASLDPSGKINMTGNYILEEGIYALSFNFLRRRFEIRKGSKITWNGEPTSGAVDITAVYPVEAAPIDLVDRQLAGATQAELNLYKTKLPFELVLTLLGTLTKPEVSFDIELPEGNYPVSPVVISTLQSRLEQLSREESEVNKQAFALVLLNRFISEDPFKSMSGGTTAESYARQSVSKLLSQQLNDFTANLITGVDLNFDLESKEDYSTGQLQNRTDLNVSASRRLLDDRITVTVGSNFDLEGAPQASEKATNIAGDISVEYQLSKDGRYLLRAYRKNEYQVAVEGHVVETGLSFVIQMDYDKFMEIFKSNKEKNKKK